MPVVVIVMMSPWWSLCSLYLWHARWSYRDDVFLVGFMYPVFMACQVELSWWCLLGGVYVPCVYGMPGVVIVMMSPWWSLCSLYLPQASCSYRDGVSLVEFMYPVFMACQMELSLATRVSVVASQRSVCDVHCSRAITSNCLSILQKRYRPHYVSDFCRLYAYIYKGPKKLPLSNRS